MRAPAQDRSYEPPREPFLKKGERTSTRPDVPPVFKSAAAFTREYVPLSYAIEPAIRSASLYTLTAKTGHGKTAFLIVAALAVATGRPDILGREVTRGRVAYLACENPDDIRMRLQVAAFLLGIDLEEIGDDLVILDTRARPEAACEELMRVAKQRPFTLVIVDTLAAFFDGANINDAVEGGEFMRRLRPLTRINGLPSVIVAAHPVKNASEDALIPYGSGAILNEVDGNLTLWKKPETGIVSLHWQGKLRGLEFQPVPFKFEISGSPDIMDVHGRQVQLPTLLPATEQSAEERQQAETASDTALLRAMIAEPGSRQQDWAATIGRATSIINRKLQRLQREKLVEKTLGKWSVTAKGKKAVGGCE